MITSVRRDVAGENTEVMSALGFHQYLFTLSKIDLFIATLLISFHVVHLVYVVLFLLSVRSPRDEDNSCYKSSQ